MPFQLCYWEGRRIPDPTDIATGNFQARFMFCEAGAELSLQYHHQCAAHWAGVQARDLGQIGNVQHGTLSRRISPYPLKEKHRLTNIGNEELVLIEGQCREYPGDNSFARLANTYGRV